MTDERKVRTAELFQGVLERDSEDQLAFLREACAGDTDLFRRVKDLLDSYAEVRTIGPVSTKSATELVDSDTLLALSERYEDIRPIGYGGMSVVLRAHDRELDKVVALKILHPSLADDERAIDRFRNEIRLALEITHKNVCRTYGLERVNGKILISMEYVEGETLRSILDRVKGVSIPQGVSWSEEICEGLAAAHDKGIIHRDLKPQNIMIDRDGHAKVMDFGIARSVEAEPTAGPIIGTPQYMSPEQALGEVLAPTTDIYSLGLVLYELFTGIRRDPQLRIPPNKANTYLPVDINSIIRKCLDEEPKRRFQTASELVGVLMSLGKTGKASGQWSGLKAHALKLSIAVICALLAAIVVSVLISRNNLEPAAGMRHERVDVIAFSPDGRTLASGSEDTTIKLWDVQNQREKFTLTGHEAQVNCLAFSMDGQWLASGSDDRTVRTWDVRTGHPWKTLPDPDKRTVAQIALSGDGSRLASTTGDRINIWDVQSGHVMYVVGHEDQVNAMAFSPDESLLASGGADRKVKIWAAGTGQLAQDLSHEQPISDLAFSLDGRWLATGVEKVIKMWSRETWVVVHLLSHDDGVQNLSFSRDGRRLASLTKDNFVTLWIAPSWDRPKSKVKIEENVYVALSPDLDYFAVAHTDGTISLRKLPQD